MPNLCPAGKKYLKPIGVKKTQWQFLNMFNPASSGDKFGSTACKKEHFILGAIISIHHFWNPSLWHTGFTLHLKPSRKDYIMRIVFNSEDTDTLALGICISRPDNMTGKTR